ncbi:MAG TPA: beta-N-acetylhexosaminidase [Candidatus Eisenbacteria bacterium]|nr:beta-N-acetylhexosaminidase [Candidatus Eisenbacteria bacterium]
MIARIVSIAALLAAALVASAALAAPAAVELRLVPYPRTVTPGAGTFALRGELRIAVARGSEEDAFAAGLLKEEIEARTSARARVVEGTDGEIVLARDGSLADAADEGYRLEVKPGSVRAAARTGAGLYYAVQTLRQLVQSDGIPAVTIADRPALRWRGLQDDVSRGPVPTVATLERRIRIAAEHKINLYVLYFEAAFAYRSQPLIAPPGGAITAAELTHLTEYAARHHVSLMAQQQSFGHLERVLGWEKYRGLAEVDGGNTLSPANEGSYALLDSMYRELAPLTSAPFFHVGGDEPADLGQGKSRTMVQATGLAGTYLRHIKRLADLLRPHQKRAMVWGDMLIKFPELIPKLGRDVVVASWEYLAHDTYAPWIKPFQDAKVEFFVCPGANNWNRVFPNLHQAIPGIRVFTREGQAAGAIGQLNCTWADNGDAPFALAWFPVLYGAAAAWQAGDCDAERFGRAFDWALFRNPGDEVSKAVDRLNGAHALISRGRPTDATLEVFWINPARSNLDRQLMGMLDQVAERLRVSQEEAIELIERARVRSARNADLLDSYAFAARRLHAIGTRVVVARRMRQIYTEALAAQDDRTRASYVTSQMTALIGTLGQARETTALLKTEHERLWLTENRPYWLDNIRGQYDQDLRAWMDKADEIEAYTVMFRNGRRLPPAEQVGLAP